MVQGHVHCGGRENSNIIVSVRKVRKKERKEGIQKKERKREVHKFIYTRGEFKYQLRKETSVPLSVF